ncbi:30S ribosomal protein S18 [Williamsia phyllosphaerae]|uniref:Small ribosomal subunit protein bS18 n=1 Tax=Williamsia phyllosphaerae TaxID=885042 RepID=A0ABQ1UHC2_9NOCA|nr:30S ribosomal protein S18 [Williamsia phyllosphaerae]GGF17423.1 30S ribosomal protein S18 [Williamsia phyllosphaerae]
MPKTSGGGRRVRAEKDITAKACSFCTATQPDIDYKDTSQLRRFLSDKGKIRSRRVTGNCVQHQRDVAIAVKNSREVSLLPFTSTAR